MIQTGCKINIRQMMTYSMFILNKNKRKSEQFVKRGFYYKTPTKARIITQKSGTGTGQNSKMPENNAGDKK